MTLNDITVAALAQLDRGHDAQTLEIWRDKLTLFANDAVIDLARVIKPTRRDAVSITGHEVELSALPREVLKVCSLTLDGKTLETRRSTAGRLAVIAVSDAANAQLTYVYAPKRLSAATDVPELPESCHALIVAYVVGRERATGDVAVQRGANVYFQMYEAGKNALRPHVGAQSDFKLINRW